MWSNCKRYGNRNTRVKEGCERRLRTIHLSGCRDRDNKKYGGANAGRLSLGCTGIDLEPFVYRLLIIRRSLPAKVATRFPRR